MSFWIGIALFMLILRATPTIIKRIEAGGGPGGPRLDELENRLQETEEQLRTLGAATDNRLVDLEERQDITERILHQVKDDRALPGA